MEIKIIETTEELKIESSYLFFYCLQELNVPFLKDEFWKDYQTDTEMSYSDRRNGNECLKWYQTTDENRGLSRVMLDVGGDIRFK